MPALACKPISPCMIFFQLFTPLSYTQAQSTRELIPKLDIASDLTQMLTTLVPLRCVAAKPATMPCWSLHVPIPLLASTRATFFQASFLAPCPRRLHHFRLPYWRHHRLSTPNLAILGFGREQVSITTGDDLRQNMRMQNLSTTRKDASAPHYEAILDIPPPILRSSGENLPSTHADRNVPDIFKGGIDLDRLHHAARLGKSAKGLPRFRAAILFVTEGALVLGYWCFVLARFLSLPIIAAVLLWNHGPLSSPSCQSNHELFRELGGGYAGKQEQGLDNRGGVWSKIISIFGILACYWDSDPDWYAGSILSHIITIFREVSLYALAISLFVYMSF